MDVGRVRRRDAIIIKAAGEADRLANSDPGGKGIRWKGLARSFGPDVGPLAAVRGADGAVAGF